MSNEIEKSSPAALGDEWEASGRGVRLRAQPDFVIAYCASDRGAARVAAALNATPLGQAAGAEGETISALRSSLAKAEAERDEARVVLSNISGALVDSGLPVPAEKDYHQAVRALTAERDEARQGLGAARNALLTEGLARDAALAQRDRLREAALHIVELGYDRMSQGVRWCRFCGRNPVNGHLRKLDGDLRPCPLGELEKALFPAPVVAQSAGDSAPSAHGAGPEKEPDHG